MKAPALWVGQFDLMVNMHTKRSAAIAMVAAGMVLSGCTGSGTDEPDPTSNSAESSPLANFDPCTALSPEELQAQGFSTESEPVDQGVGEVGCDFESDTVLLTLLKGEDSDMGYWNERRDNFDEFTTNQVGSHQGIKGIAAGGTGSGVCRQIILVGGGSVIAQVTQVGGEVGDPCSDAMKYAQLIEPKLPA